jgi:cytochrome c oxidase assembly factor CtaG
MIGVLTFILFALFMMERITVNEVVALLMTLNSIGFFLCKDGELTKGEK